MMRMLTGWIDRRDGKCPSDLDFLGVVIWAYLEQAANIGKDVFGGFVVAEWATCIVQGFQILE